MTKHLALCLGVAALAACSKDTAPRRAPEGGTTSSNASSIDACALLTPAEIQQALGVAMKPGVKQTTDDASHCQWEAQDENDASGASVSVSVATFDATLFGTMSSAKAAVPVSGFGTRAYKDYPHGGDLAIEHDGHEVDVGAIDFKLQKPQLDEVTAKLAKLVLSRL
jgi:Protein of unknown function (DUF3558)